MGGQLCSRDVGWRCGSGAIGRCPSISSSTRSPHVTRRTHRLEAAQREPAVHGREPRALRVLQEVQLLAQLRVPHSQHAQRGVAVAADVLGAAGHADVGAQVQRPLVKGRQEAVVDTHQRARLVRERHNRRNVAHLCTAWPAARARVGRLWDRRESGEGQLMVGQLWRMWHTAAVASQAAAPAAGSTHLHARVCGRLHHHQARRAWHDGRLNGPE